ncbi:MAG: phosphatidate cytidylyltransferase [Clostridia bacterium]|nr:phosphatidate cytidylyltransferase [Clostridia bacterium]
MNLKRVLSALIGFPIVAVALIYANNYIIDVIISLIALISIHEFYNAISKDGKPVRWIGYVSCISIAFIHIIPLEQLHLIIPMAISSIILLLFLQVILSQMETNIKDIAYTLFGIFYVAVFLMFLAIIRGMENGKILIWYVLFASWTTDIFAYLVGKHLGKHKFSKISPNKTIEGCVGGTIGSIIAMLAYTYCINSYLGANYSYLLIAITGLILSLVSQIGDFAASTIKRYVDIKDYSDLIPGHGGMLDRVDSLLFIAPFAYILFSLM